MIKQALGAIALAIAAEGLNEATRARLYSAAHDIKGEGATFGYPLAARIADTLCGLMDGIADETALPLGLMMQHVEAIRGDGLLMDTQTFREHVPVGTALDAGGVQGAQLVLCCVKSTDTAHAAAEMAPHLAPDAIVLSLQNGYDNAARLQALLGRAVHPAGERARARVLRCAPGDPRGVPCCGL